MAHGVGVPEGEKFCGSLGQGRVHGSTAIGAGLEPHGELDARFDDAAGSVIHLSLAVFHAQRTALDLGNGVENLADRKSTRLNSSHVRISYAVFCLKKKKKK